MRLLERPIGVRQDPTTTSERGDRRVPGTESRPGTKNAPDQPARASGREDERDPGPSRAACRARRRVVLRRRIARMGAARNRRPPSPALPLVARLEPHDHSAFPTVRFHHGRIPSNSKAERSTRPRRAAAFRLSGEPPLVEASGRCPVQATTASSASRRSDGRAPPVAIRAAEAHLGVVRRAGPQVGHVFISDLLSCKPLPRDRPP